MIYIFSDAKQTTNEVERILKIAQRRHFCNSEEFAARRNEALKEVNNDQIKAQIIEEKALTEHLDKLGKEYIAKLRFVARNNREYSCIIKREKKNPSIWAGLQLSKGLCHRKSS